MLAVGVVQVKRDDADELVAFEGGEELLNADALQHDGFPAFSFLLCPTNGRTQNRQRRNGIWFEAGRKSEIPRPHPGHERSCPTASTPTNP